MKPWFVALLLTIAALPLLGGSCEENSIYSEECRDLADGLAERIDSLAAEVNSCAGDEDCTYAAVVVPCNRDAVHGTVIDQSETEAFRDAVKQLAADQCDAENIHDCNPHCGTEGSLIFPVTGAACDDGTCVAVELDDGGRSLPSAELCEPQKFVYLPADLSPGL
ncbi:MAG TPA: hypothetical protein PK961_02280 [bacterium]|nr:hypothetical protein [bacterium]